MADSAPTAQDKKNHFKYLYDGLVKKAEEKGVGNPELAAKLVVLLNCGSSNAAMSMEPYSKAESYEYYAPTPTVLSRYV